MKNCYYCKRQIKEDTQGKIRDKKFICNWCYDITKRVKMKLKTENIKLKLETTALEILEQDKALYCERCLERINGTKVGEPCPFCGYKMEWTNDHHGYFYDHETAPYWCPCKVNQLLDEEDILNWNKRV